MSKRILGWSPVERLEFAMKWESVRITYFRKKGDKAKVDELTQKIQFIKVELTVASYERQ